MKYTITQIRKTEESTYLSPWIIHDSSHFDTLRNKIHLVCGDEIYNSLLYFIYEKNNIEFGTEFRFAITLETNAGTDILKIYSSIQDDE